MRVAVERGVEVEVDVRGTGPTLICVHGFGGAKEDFWGHLDELASRWRVVAFDLRGHGDSDQPDDVSAYSLDRLALDVEAVADAVGGDRFRLLGHSMGGMVARRVALRCPERVEGLVLMSTAAGPPAGIDPSLADAGAELALSDWAALKQLLDTVRPLGTPAFEQLLAEPAFAEFVEWKWSRLAPTMWAALAPQLAREVDELAGLAGVICPTLVLVGELDSTFYEASLAMAEVLPDGRLVVVADAGHHPQFENPTAWIDAVVTFLAEVDAGVVP